MQVRKIKKRFMENFLECKYSQLRSNMPPIGKDFENYLKSWLFCNAKAPRFLKILIRLIVADPIGARVKAFERMILNPSEIASRNRSAWPRVTDFTS